MLALLIALATVAPNEAPGCASFVTTETGSARAADVRRVARAWKKDAAAIRIEGVLAMGGWRMVWAKAPDAEPGVFVFQGRDAHYAYRDVWGGVLAGDADVADAVRWAEELGAPHRVARCFAARLLSDGP